MADNKERVLELDTGFSMATWRSKSKAGELCGILGCFNEPKVGCSHCGNHYCDEHKWVIKTPAHKS